MSETRPLIALAGNPNSGKTTLFNALTGARARTGNYPGVTVDRRSGKLHLPSGREAELLDVPGTYSLSARSPEEQVAVDVILPVDGKEPDAVLVVLDATALGRHLYLAEQIRATGLRVVYALNMMDEARDAGLEIDEAALGESLGVACVPIVASRGEGLDAAKAALEAALASDPPEAVTEPVEGELAADVEAVEARLSELFAEERASARRARALFLLLSIGDGDELEGVDASLREIVERRRQRAVEAGRDIDLEIVGPRFARLELALDTALSGELEPSRPWTERLDHYLTHPFYGLAAFAIVMFLLFEALFAWSEPVISIIEDGVGALQGVASQVIPEGPVQGLVTDGVIAGVGNVVVFVPQIALLFLFIAFLEDSGYLARVAFVIDRVMGAVGLHGKAFVPLLSGFACAIPAVMATRTIENRKDRLVTMLALPLMSCSARLPIYTLVIAVVFPTDQRIAGFLSVGAVALFSMYTLSVVATLGAAAVLRRTVLRGPRPTFVLELPPYRRPGLGSVLRQTGLRVRTFLVDAGTIILAMTIVLWGLLSFPVSDEASARFDAERQEARADLSSEPEALAERLEGIDAREGEVRIQGSVAGRVGRAIEPALEPLGYDWRVGIGLLGSFAAREVLVSTFGIIWGIGGEADEDDLSLRETLRETRWPDGRQLFTPLMGVSLMVFFVLAAQCMSTIAVVKRESGSWKWPLLMFSYMTALAYVAALITYQGGLWLGLG